LDAPTPVLLGFPHTIEREKAVNSQILWVFLDALPGQRLVANEDFWMELKEPYMKNIKHYVSQPYSELRILQETRFFTDPEVRKSTFSIVNEFTDYWESVIRKIPLETPMSPKGDFIDVEELAEGILVQFPQEDHPFLRQFLNTQIFVTHVEERKQM
jgi:hypothetical protein